MSLGHCLHALFLQTVHHVVEGILVRQCRQRLKEKTKNRYRSVTEVRLRFKILDLMEKSESGELWQFHSSIFNVLVTK